MKTEKPKRLEPVKNTLRLLCAYSGNLCAFPGCNHLIFNEDGDLIAELCHIEAALPEGERFNPNMTNEDRRDFSNLMFMCHAHHVTTDDVNKYPVHVLKQIKANHEVIFSLDRMSDRIAEKLYDYTSTLVVSDVKNLNNLYRFLNILNRDEETIDIEVKEFNRQLNKFKNLSVEAKITLISSVVRLKEDYWCKQKFVDMREVGRVLDSYKGETAQYFDELVSSGLMLINEIEVYEDRYENRHQLVSKNEYVDNSFFEEIQDYCQIMHIDFREFMLNLNFSCLDSD